MAPSLLLRIKNGLSPSASSVGPRFQFLYRCVVPNPPWELPGALHSHPNFAKLVCV